MQPQVSVIMPMRDAQRFVGAALRSILADTDKRVEVIVVNDHSSDGSIELVRSQCDERVRLIDSPGHGIAAALNAGLAAARAALVMRCDADDLYPAGRIARQLAWMDAHPRYGAVCGRFSAIDARGRTITDMRNGRERADITSELLTGNTRTHLCTFAVQREIALRLGGFRPFFVTGEDIDFQLRLAEATRVMYVPEHAYCYRVHGTSMTHARDRGHDLFYERTARLFLEQRRARGRDDLEAALPPPRWNETERPQRWSPRDQILGYLEAAAWMLHAEGDKGGSLAIGLRALRYERLSWRVWRNLAALLIKRARPMPGFTDSVRNL